MDTKTIQNAKCFVITDRFGDTHACEINSRGMWIRQVRDFADNTVGVDDNESFTVHLSHHADPGAARLFTTDLPLWGTFKLNSNRHLVCIGD